MYDYTDRFLQLPIKTFNSREQELTGKAEYFDSDIYILPTEISCFKQSSDEELSVDEMVHITLKNGHGFNVYLTLIEFKDLLNAHAAYNAL